MLFAASTGIRSFVDGGDGDDVGGGGSGSITVGEATGPAIGATTAALAGATGASPAAAPTNEARLRDLTGFVVPVKGACLPTTDSLLPSAPRAYRNGVHEGIDFYDGYVCVAVGSGTEVLAVRDGIVVRADATYAPLTRDEVRRIDSSPQMLDRFRGRQVWIDHGIDEGSGQRVVSRYAHLLSLAAAARPGERVRAGQLIGFVGNTGTPESLDDPLAEHHLHFEIRIGERYLGQGMTPAAALQAYRRAFSGAGG